MQRVVVVYRWPSGMLHSAHNHFTDIKSLGLLAVYLDNGNATAWCWILLII